MMTKEQWDAIEETLEDTIKFRLSVADKAETARLLEAFRKHREEVAKSVAGKKLNKALKKR